MSANGATTFEQTTRALLRAFEDWASFAHEPHVQNSFAYESRLCGCRRLSWFRCTLPNVPILALTATATQRVSVDIIRELRMKQEVVFTSSFNRPNLVYHVLRKGKDVLDVMAERLIQKQYDPFCTLKPGIIYCHSRNDCEKIATELEVRADALHCTGGLPGLSCA